MGEKTLKTLKTVNNTMQTFYWLFIHLPIKLTRITLTMDFYLLLSKHHLSLL